MRVLDKSIDSAYYDVFENANLILDPLHVHKKILSKIGTGKAIGLSLYEKALHAPTKAAVGQILGKYGTAQ